MPMQLLLTVIDFVKKERNELLIDQFLEEIEYLGKYLSFFIRDLNDRNLFQN